MHKIYVCSEKHILVGCSAERLFWTFFLTIAENLFKQSLDKKEQCANVEISQNLCDDLFSSIKQFTLGFRIIF